MKTVLIAFALVLLIMTSGWSVRAQEADQRPPISIENVGQVTMLGVLQPEGEAIRLNFRPDGLQLAVSGVTDIAIWDMLSAEPLQKLTAPTAEEEFVGDMEFSPDGTRLAAGIFPNFQMRQWDLLSEADATTQQPPDEIHNNIWAVVEFSPDGSMIAWGADNCTTYLWDVAAEEIHTRFTGSGFGNVSDIAFTPDGEMLATSCGELSFWDIANETTTLDPIGWGNTDLEFSPDGSMLAGGDEILGEVTVWDAVTGETLFMFPLEGDQRFFSLAFSADSSVLAIGRNDEIQLWDAHRYELLQTLPIPGKNAISITFSPDGTLLASATGDSVQFWGIETGEALAFAPPPAAAEPPAAATDAPDLPSEEVSEPAVTSAGPQAGHWEGSSPYIAFDITASGTLINFEAGFPFGGSNCHVTVAEEISLAEDGSLVVQGLDVPWIGDFTGVFDTSTSITGTYWAGFCGNGMSFVETRYDWSAEWMSD